MKYSNIGDAIAGAIDQAQRGLTNHEYDLHINRLKRYYNKVEECQDALSVFNEQEHDDPQYIKWQKMLVKYESKLEAERNLGL